MYIVVWQLLFIKYNSINIFKCHKKFKMSSCLERFSFIIKYFNRRCVELALADVEDFLKNQGGQVAVS